MVAAIIRTRMLVKYIYILFMFTLASGRWFRSISNLLFLDNAGKVVRMTLATDRKAERLS